MSEFCVKVSTLFAVIVLSNEYYNDNIPWKRKFVTNHQPKIAEWTLATSVTTSQSMHRNWVNHFNIAIRETRQDVLLRNTKFNAQKWDKLFEELSALRDFESESRIEGQKLATMSMKKAAKRSQRILAESSRSSHKEVEQEEENEEENENGQEEQEPVDQLYKLYYKKFNKHEFNGEEKALLKQIMKKKTCIKDKLLGLGAKLLLEKTTNAQDDMMLKLSLSNIANLIHPESYEVLKKILTKNEMKTIDKSNLDLYVGLSDEDENMLKKVLKSGGAEANTDLMMIEILTEQLELRKAGAKNSDTYKLLNILRYIIERAEE
ncbi:hypothetical protein G6F62_008321 [Rhizopus arrhizus]|nr:hypothetical protein G6F62_008321 [Rhizopus arrhizus]